MKSCYTQEPIAPGACINVQGGPGLSGNREVMVNPPGAGHVNECSCLDSWTLFSGSASCGPPSCAESSSEGISCPVNLSFMIDKSGSMDGAKWSGAVSALRAVFSSSTSAGLKVALEMFPLSASGSQDG